MNYRQYVTLRRPRLILLLLDQSSIMSQEFVTTPVTLTKAEFASLAINRVIYDIIMANTDGSGFKRRCFLAVIGYGSTVHTIVADWIDQVASNPIRMEKLKKREPDGAGGTYEVDFEFPIYVEPMASNGSTMQDAFNVANQLLSDWIGKYPDAPAPIVVNMTGGLPDDKQKVSKVVQQIQQLKTGDGNVLVFNHLFQYSHYNNTWPPKTSMFDTEEELFFFSISSKIPLFFCEQVKFSGIEIKKGAVGFSCGTNCLVILSLPLFIVS